MTTATTTTNTTAGSTAPTFTQYVLKLTWDDILALALQSDSYYYVYPDPTCSQTGKEGKSTRRSGKLTALSRCVRRYFATSSRTRLCVHGAMIAYTLMILSSKSFVVNCSVELVDLGSCEGRAPLSEGLIGSIQKFLRKLLLSSSSSSSDTFSSSLSSSTTTPAYLYQSREGMQLLLQSRVPFLTLTAHAVSSMLLLPLTFFQKESVGLMAFASAHPGSPDGAAASMEKGNRETQEKPEKKHNTTSAAKETPSMAERFKAVSATRGRHGMIGFATAASMATMVISGVAMRHVSFFSQPSASGTVEATTGAGTATNALTTAVRARSIGFDTAILCFSIPWVFFCPAVVFTSKTKKRLGHAIMGALVCKACLAVTLTRTLGGCLQRMVGVHVNVPQAVIDASKGKADMQGGGVISSEQQPAVVVMRCPGDLERMYYVSIVTAATVVGAWALWDIYQLVSATRKQYGKKYPRKQQ